MKKKNQKIVDEFLFNANEIGDDVLDDTEKMLGMLPFIFPVLRERAGTFALSSLADYRICRPEHLSPKTAELVAVAAAAGAGADNCLRVHMKAAVKEGASRDEIFDAVLIAATIGKTKVLASSLRQLSEVFPKEKDKTVPKSPKGSGKSQKSQRKTR